MKNYQYKEISIFLDDEDYPRIAGYRLSLAGKRKDIVMQYRTNTSLGRFILKYKGPLLVDHKDRNIFNFQKENLRLATNSQSGANTGPREGKKYKGVSYHKRDRFYQALLEKNNKVYYGGYHSTEESAARAYDKLAKVHFGEFAYLNFPEEIL